MSAAVNSFERYNYKAMSLVSMCEEAPFYFDFNKRNVYRFETFPMSLLYDRDEKAHSVLFSSDTKEFFRVLFTIFSNKTKEYLFYSHIASWKEHLYLLYYLFPPTLYWQAGPTNSFLNFRSYFYNFIAKTAPVGAPLSDVALEHSILNLNIKSKKGEGLFFKSVTAAHLELDCIITFLSSSRGDFFSCHELSYDIPYGRPSSFFINSYDNNSIIYFPEKFFSHKRTLFLRSFFFNAILELTMKRFSTYLSPFFSSFLLVKVKHFFMLKLSYALTTFFSFFIASYRKLSLSRWKLVTRRRRALAKLHLLRSAVKALSTKVLVRVHRVNNQLFYLQKQKHLYFSALAITSAIYFYRRANDYPRFNKHFIFSSPYRRVTLRRSCVKSDFFLEPTSSKNIIASFKYRLWNSFRSQSLIKVQKQRCRRATKLFIKVKSLATRRRKKFMSLRRIFLRKKKRFRFKYRRPFFYKKLLKGLVPLFSSFYRFNIIPEMSLTTTSDVELEKEEPLVYMLLKFLTGFFSIVRKVFKNSWQNYEALNCNSSLAKRTAIATRELTYIALYQRISKIYHKKILLARLNLLSKKIKRDYFVRKPWVRIPLSKKEKVYYRRSFEWKNSRIFSNEARFVARGLKYEEASLRKVAPWLQSLRVVLARAGYKHSNRNRKGKGIKRFKKGKAIKHFKKWKSTFHSSKNTHFSLKETRRLFTLLKNSS